VGVGARLLGLVMGGEGCRCCVLHDSMTSLRCFGKFQNRLGRSSTRVSIEVREDGDRLSSGFSSYTGLVLAGISRYLGRPQELPRILADQSYVSQSKSLRPRMVFPRLRAIGRGIVVQAIFKVFQVEDADETLTV